MAIKVVRNSTKQDTSSARPRASSASHTSGNTAQAERHPARRQEPSKAWIIWVAGSLFLLLTIILVSAAASNKRRRRPAPRQVATQSRRVTREPYKPPVDPALGMTWAEYEKANSKNNKALNERKAISGSR